MGSNDSLRKFLLCFGSLSRAVLSCYVCVYVYYMVCGIRFFDKPRQRWGWRGWWLMMAGEIASLMKQKTMPRVHQPITRDANEVILCRQTFYPSPFYHFLSLTICACMRLLCSILLSVRLLSSLNQSFSRRRRHRRHTHNKRTRLVADLWRSSSYLSDPFIRHLTGALWGTGRPEYRCCK